MPTVHLCTYCGSARHQANACEYVRVTDKLTCSPNIEAIATLPKSESDIIVRVLKQGLFAACPPEYFDKLMQNIDLARAGRLAAAASAATTAAPSTAQQQQV